LLAHRSIRHIYLTPGFELRNNIRNIVFPSAQCALFKLLYTTFTFSASFEYDICIGSLDLTPSSEKGLSVRGRIGWFAVNLDFVINSVFVVRLFSLYYSDRIRVYVDYGGLGSLC
jgi:hypothetical protein